MLKKFSVSVLTSVLLVACASSAPDNSAARARERANAGYSDLNREVGPSPYAAQSSEKIVNAESQKAAAINYAGLQKPVIMAMPVASSNGSDPMDVVRSNPFAKSMMEAVNEFLTGKGYEVRSLEGQTELDDLVKLQSEITGGEDVSYVAGLMLGADVYIKFTGSLRSDMVTVELSAYETATARLLGTQTGMVKDNGVGAAKRNYLVNDAVKKAMPALEEKIFSYWAEDLKKGSQYKIIMKIDEKYSGADVEDLQDNVVNAMRSKFSSLRVNGMTERTIDVIVYADPAAFPDSYAVYSEIRKAVSSVATAKKNNIAKKLIMLELQ